MVIRALSRFSATLFLVALTAGCSMSRLESPRSFFNACTFSFGGCMYEGSYEPGEEKYAEEEAKRLNREQIEKLKRQSL